MTGYDFHPRKRVFDLDEIWEFIRTDNLDAADRTIAEILSAIRGLGFISQSVAIDFADFVCGQDQPDVNHAWRFPTCLRYHPVRGGAPQRILARILERFRAFSSSTTKIGLLSEPARRPAGRFVQNCCSSQIPIRSYSSSEVSSLRRS